MVVVDQPDAKASDVGDEVVATAMVAAATAAAVAVAVAAVVTAMDATAAASIGDARESGDPASPVSTIPAATR